MISYCIKYIAIVVTVWIAVYILYLALSKGLSASARHQQASRFAIASLLAVAPFAIAGVEHITAGLWAIIGGSAAWIMTWPLLDLISRRHHATEIDNKMDFATGLYLCGWLSSAWLAVEMLWPGNAVAGSAFAAIEMPLIMLIVFQWGYYAIYGNAVDHDGLKLVMNTYPSEIWEYLRSFPVWAVMAGVAGCLCFTGMWFMWNVGSAPAGEGGWMRVVAEFALFIILSLIMFKGGHSPWRRSGLPTLYFDNRDYMHQNRLYTKRANERKRAFASVAVPRKHNPGRTFVLVIGESASREYMSAFTPQPGGVNTTPWLSKMAAGEEAGGAETVLFDNAYSCHFQTVPTLTHALTAANQKNTLKFHKAPSIVDAAHALGMRVSWFSNQSHIGANDTPVSLMAESADECAWTRLALNRIPYDEALLDFLPRLSPETDNLLVLHLKGSHFNYESRYPAEYTLIPPAAGKEGYEAHYRNSIAYTDKVLSEIYRYCTDNLNLAAMIYCSDHADIPTARRSPVFNGVARLKIPLSVTLSPYYAAENPRLVEELRTMRHDLFINDFLYDIALAVLSPENFSLPHPEPPLYSLLGQLEIK